MARGLRRLLVLLASGWLAAPVCAQDRDPATAQALFDQARELMEAKRYAEACPRLIESQRLDPGIGTQFHLASCYEGQGKLASAWATFLEVASIAAASGQGDRERIAKHRAAKLELRLPRLAIVVTEAARVPGLQVTRSGVPVGDVQWGTAMPADPGQHRVSATAPGHRDFVAVMVLREGATTTVTIPELPPSPATVSQAPAAHSQAASARQAAASPDSPAQPAALGIDHTPFASLSRTQRGVIIGLGSFAVATLGVGTALGAQARSKYEDSKDECNPDDENRCNDQGVALRDDAIALGNGSTAAFVVGGTAAVGALVVWLIARRNNAKHTARRSRRAEIGVGVRRESFALSGTF